MGTVTALEGTNAKVPITLIVKQHNLTFCGKGYSRSRLTFETITFNLLRVRHPLVRNREHRINDKI